MGVVDHSARRLSAARMALDGGAVRRLRLEPAGLSRRQRGHARGERGRSLDAHARLAESSEPRRDRAGCGELGESGLSGGHRGGVVRRSPAPGRSGGLGVVPDVFAERPVRDARGPGVPPRLRPGPTRAPARLARRDVGLVHDRAPDEGGSDHAAGCPARARRLPAPPARAGALARPGGMARLPGEAAVLRGRADLCRDRPPGQRRRQLPGHECEGL